MGERIFFAIAAVGIISSAVAVITLRNPFRAAVALIVSLLSVARDLPAPARPVRGDDPGDRLCRCDRGAVPVRDRLPGRQSRRRSASTRWPGTRSLAWLAIIGLGIEGFLALGNSRPSGHPVQSRRRCRTSAARRPSGTPSSITSSRPSRAPRSCSWSRRSAPCCWRAVPCSGSAADDPASPRPSRITRRPACRCRGTWRCRACCS